MSDKKNTKKTKKFSLKRLIYNDKYLIIFSLILAVLVWISSSISMGADENKTIKIEVPIQLGDQVSDQLGMKYYSLQDTVEISVNVTGKKYVIGQVADRDLNVKFDTSSVSKTGEQTIPILITNGSEKLDYKVTNYYPTQIQGYFDVSESKNFNIKVNNADDFVADGYTIGTPVLSEDEVTVTGPKSYVDKITDVSVDVLVNTKTPLTEPYTDECLLQIDGDDIQNRYLTITSKSDSKTILSKVSVTLPILKITELPVAVTLDEKPSKLESDAVTVTYSVDNIKAGILESANIKTATIGAIGFNQIPIGGKSFKFDVTGLNGITVLDKKLTTITAKVDVNSSYKQKNVNTGATAVIIEGIPSGYTAKVSSIGSPSVTVIGPKDSVDTISSGSLSLKCDISNKTESGTYVLTPSLVSVNDCWVYGNYTVDIEISKG